MGGDENTQGPPFLFIALILLSAFLKLDCKLFKSLSLSEEKEKEKQNCHLGDLLGPIGERSENPKSLQRKISCPFPRSAALPTSPFPEGTVTIVTAHFESFLG